MLGRTRAAYSAHAAMGRGGLVGLCFAQNLSGCGLPVRPSWRQYVTLAPIPYDPHVATNSSSWRVVQDERAKSLPPGCWGSSLDFRLMRTPLTDLPPCRQRTLSAGVFLAPYLLSLDARTLSHFGHPFPFPSSSPFNSPSDPLTLFLSFRASAPGSFLGQCPFLLLDIDYVGFACGSSRRIADG